MTLQDLPEVPDCSSVSQLPPINPFSEPVDKLSSDTLILVSQKQPLGEYETDSQYLSRNATIAELDEHVENALDIQSIRDELKKKVDWDALSSYATLCADTGIPYIISSFYISAGTVVSVDGYALSDGLSIAIDKNGYIPNRLSTHIEYDSVQNRIVLRNFDKTIMSYVDRDDILNDLEGEHTLSNVTISKNGLSVYLHFVIKRTPESEPTLKKITVSLSAIAPYEFKDGVKTVLPETGEDGKLSVVADYPQISTTLELSSYVLKSKLTGYSETENEKKYKVSLNTNDDTYYVSVPWISGGNIVSCASDEAYRQLTHYPDTLYVTPDLSILSVEVATETSVGGIMLGYSENNKNYAVKLANNRAYVTVPWISGGNIVSCSSYVQYARLTHDSKTLYVMPGTAGGSTLSRGNSYSASARNSGTSSCGLDNNVVSVIQIIEQLQCRVTALE